MADIQSDNVQSSLSRIFKSGEYSDMTICCGDREFKVHRAIVSSQCRFFAAACDGEFQESINRKVLLGDDDADAVERMLSYLYSSNYDDGSSSEQHTDKGKNGSTKAINATGSRRAEAEASPEITEPDKVQAIVEGLQENSLVKESGLLNNVRVYAIADKYGILELKALAKVKFLSQSSSLLSSDDFPEIVRMAYKSIPESDRALRNVVSAICAKHVRKLIESQVFQSIVGDVGDFGYDVLRGALRADDEQLKQAQVQKAALQKKIKDGKLEILHLDTQLKQTQETLQRAVAVANELESCRQCKAGHYGRR